MKFGQAVTDVFSLDVHSLAVFRFLLGLFLIVDLSERLRTLVLFYTDSGVFPRSTAGYALHDWRISLHMANGEPVFQAVLFIIAGLAAFSLMIGYKTRLVTIISWLMLISLHNRNPFLLYGSDTMLRAVLFWAMFLPLGQVWSVDSKLSQESRSSLSNRVVSVGSACFIIQMAMVYLFASALKSDALWREDGTAIEYALRLRQLGTPLGLYLSEIPWFTRTATFGTVFLEGIVPWFLFIPWLSKYTRLPIVILFIGFHAGIASSMAVGLFPYIGMLAWVALLPGGFWDFVFKRLGRSIVQEQPESKASVQEEPTKSIIAAGLGSGVAIASLALLLWLNFTTVWDRPDLRKPLTPILYATQLRQEWNMFAPKPLRRTRWFIVEVWTSDGQRYDALKDWQEVDESLPTYAHDAMPSVRWRKYLNAMRERDRSREWQQFCRYFARSAESKFGKDTVELVQVRFFQQLLLPDGEVRDIKPRTLYKFNY